MMDDLISRQTAIDRINKQREHLQPDVYPQDKIGDAAYRICAEFIERLPSAQPTKPNAPNALNALDCISRQDAIRWVKTECNPYGNPTLDFESGKKVIEHLKQMSSAQPKPKKGKWIVRDNPRTGWYRVTCSECGEDVTSTIPMIGFFPNAKPLWDYCPYCGAKMEVEDNGKQ